MTTWRVSWNAIATAVAVTTMAVCVALVPADRSQGGVADVTITIGSAGVAPGGSVMVDITVTPAPGIMVNLLDLEVNYDNAVLSATGCTATGGACNPTHDPNTSLFSWASLTALSGPLGAATFSAIAAPGASSSLNVVVVTCSDTVNTPLVCADVDGSITIDPPEPTPTPTPGPGGNSPVFNPSSVGCFEDMESAPECDGDSSPGAASDIRLKYCLGWGEECGQQPVIAEVEDSVYRLIVVFAPPGWSVPDAGSVPVGALVGAITSSQTWGFLNGPCSSSLDVRYTLMGATVNIGDPIAVAANGSPFPLAQDLSPQNGLPDGADRYPAFLDAVLSGAQPQARFFGMSLVQNVWNVLNLAIFQPGAHLTLGTSIDVKLDPGLGYPIVAVIQNPTLPPAPGALADNCAPERDEIVILGKTLNNPCTPTPQPGGNCPGPVVVQNQGYPFLPCESVNKLDEDADGKINDGCPQVGSISESGAQCDNATSDDGEDSTPNDGCPPDGGVSEGSRIPGTCSGTDEGGCVSFANGAAGQRTLTIWTESLRDADGDGIENALDVCALIPNGSWNPRAVDPEHDPDNDGLPSVCDPDPDQAGDQSPLTCVTGISGFDEDGDCLSNRLDNCPVVNQLQDPGSPPQETNLPVQTDTDFDQIGDVCDPTPTEPSGPLVSLCLRMPLVVGSSPAPVVRTIDPNPGPGCADLKFGDVDCGGAVNSVDALKVLRHWAGLPNTIPDGCDFGGDVDCSDETNAVDALKLLRYAASLSNVVPPGCKPIGS